MFSFLCSVYSGVITVQCLVFMCSICSGVIAAQFVVFCVVFIVVLLLLSF
jgi:hypothetical protein